MRNTRKNLKTNYKINKGGKVIASGGYGCIFDPALKCQHSLNREPNKITKLMTEKHAIQEFEEINNIKNKLNSITNYKNYFILNDVTICKPSKLSNSDLTAFNNKCKALPKNNITKTNINSKLDEVMALNIPYGGLPVDDYIYNNGNFQKLYYLHIKLVKLLKNGIIPMNQKGIYHSDIKDSNVLVYDTNNIIQTRLIDWGLSVEYNEKNNLNFPKNWKNRPLQFNVPFSVIIFTDLFYEKYSNYLKNGGLIKEDNLRPFVIDYLNKWFNYRGAGHYKFINEIMYILYSNSITSITEKNKPDIIETEITMPIIISYIVNVLVHFTKFNEDGSLNLREYLNKVYIKIVDIWGFICIYYPYLEMLQNNYFYLKENEMKIFKHLQFIFNHFLYNPRHKEINLKELFLNLKILGNLLRRIISKHKKSIRIFTTKKIINSKIFKRKTLRKKFQKPFFLSLNKK
jgi:hypothetical protein